MTFFGASKRTGVRLAAVAILLCAMFVAASTALAAGQREATSPLATSGGGTFSALEQLVSDEPAAHIVGLAPEHSADMARLGMHPIRPGHAPAPDGNALGTSNAFMSVNPEVVAPSTMGAFGTLASSFAPTELVDYYLNGVVAATFAADANGRLAVNVSTGTGTGYITIEAVGQTSAKRAGGVTYVSDSAPTVTGLNAAPHAVVASGSATINLYRLRYTTSSPVTIARTGVMLGTVTTNTRGRFNAVVTVPAGANGSAVYSSYGATAGSLAGQSVEERSDAGPPPEGDQNPSRGFIDRPIAPETGGAFMLFSGEGFQP